MARRRPSEQGYETAERETTSSTRREDGVARELLKVEPATATLDVMLLIDDSEALNPALQPMREGIGRFIDKMQGQDRLKGTIYEGLLPPPKKKGSKE